MSYQAALVVEERHGLGNLVETHGHILLPAQPLAIKASQIVTAMLEIACTAGMLLEPTLALHNVQTICRFSSFPVDASAESQTA